VGGEVGKEQYEVTVVETAMGHAVIDGKAQPRAGQRLADRRFDLSRPRRQPAHHRCRSTATASAIAIAHGGAQLKVRCWRRALRQARRPHA
jgi:hypothetical protein